MPCENCTDSLLQIRPRHTGGTLQWRLQIALTYTEDSLSVDEWFVTELQDFFIARSFPLIDELFPDPSHQWIKPEQRLNQHVHCSPKVIAPADMAQFVDQNRVELFRRHSRRYALRKDQHRRENANHSG